MNPSRIKALLIDLDGTLVDSAPDLAASVNHALRSCDLPAIDENRIRCFIGNGAVRLIHRAITNDPAGIAANTLFEPVAERFFEHYSENVCRLSKTYPGVTKTLDQLHSTGYVFACITNKPKQFTSPLLEALSLSPYFSIVLSGDSLGKKKPAADQLMHAAQYCGLEVNQCVMVGDTEIDMAAAENCEMDGIFVSYGYGSADDLSPGFAGLMVDSFEQIAEVL